MEFKDRLMARMKALSLTATDISKQTGVSKATVSFWVNGTNGATGRNLLSLARALDCSPEWLTDGGKENAPAGLLTADQAPSTEQQVRQMLSKVKGLSAEARLRIEAAAAEPVQGEAEVLPAGMGMLRPGNEEILIPQYDIRGAMGHGQVPAEYNEAVRNIVVREQTLREKGITYTSLTSLAMITGWGQSMEGTINDQDLVVVDRGINDFVGEGIYVVTWHGELYIKRLMRLDEDHYRLISDNPHYENQTARIDDVTIHAKVVLVWNARKV